MFVETKLSVSAQFTQECLGTKNLSPEAVIQKYADSKVDFKPLDEQEAAELMRKTGQEVMDEITTVFHKDKTGNPGIWDYQIKGFLKEACKNARKADGTISNELKAYRQVIDGLVFVRPRWIPFKLPEGGKVGYSERPLRAETAQGPRVCLARSESVPEGTKFSFDVVTLAKDNVPYINEWLSYGQYKGLGQWRNSGRGSFVVEI